MQRYKGFSLRLCAFALGEPVTRDEIIACLKRVRKSIHLWTREGGRQGYLTFVSRFIS